MKMFEIYTHEFELEGQQYKLIPVNGTFVGLFYSIAEKMEKAGDDASVVLDEEVITKLHKLALETFKASYPEEDVTKLDRFVTQKLMKLIEPVLKVNTVATE